MTRANWAGWRADWGAVAGASVEGGRPLAGGLPVGQSRVVKAAGGDADIVVQPGEIASVERLVQRAQGADLVDCAEWPTACEG